MLAGFSVKDGRIELNGYPEGTTVRGLALPQARELCRLMLFRNDLTLVTDWLHFAGGLDAQNPLREALCSAALVRFCCCFDGTSGLRSMPLKQKKIFKGEDRRALERLFIIRNKAVAHNEHLYPGEFPLIVLDAAGTAIEAVVLTLDAPFSAMSEVDDLKRLARGTLEWVTAEFEAVAKEIVNSINSIPEDERRLLRDSTPEFKIEFGASEDRFVRK